MDMLYAHYRVFVFLFFCFLLILLTTTYNAKVYSSQYVWANKIILMLFIFCISIFIVIIVFDIVHKTIFKNVLLILL